MTKDVGPAGGLCPAPGEGPDAFAVVARRALYERLSGKARVSVVSAPAGSGKTVLLRSWIADAGLAASAAWVSVGRDERDPGPFWLSVLQALSQTAPASGLVQPVLAAPDLDGWALQEKLLSNLVPLDEPLRLVIDDAHELSAVALRQLELLMMRAPPGLQFVLATRHDVRLGLHRLRLEGELAEIRASDLTFTLDEARMLLTSAGAALDGPAVAKLHERTEGWAAGLRLAALALAGGADPDRFVTEFSGSERTVSEYLLAEVLDRQSEQVRRLLLRTSVLERVNGELADLLTGDENGERVLQDLEAAGAFVASLDGTRSWFRYHQMFADMLRLELRRTSPGAVAGLHTTASDWLAAHGFGIAAVRHAQAARDWDRAAQLLTRLWPALHLDGQAATVHELLAGFPPDMCASDAGLAVVAAADQLAQGSLTAAGHYLALAAQPSGPPPPGQQQYQQLLLWVVGLLLDRHRGNLQAVTENAQDLPVMAGVADAAQPGLGTDLTALALIILGSTEFWRTASASSDAKRSLQRGITLARQGGRPYLEFTGLAYQALQEFSHSFARSAELGRQAVEVADRHGWTDDPAVAAACLVVSVVLIYQGQPDAGEPWLERAERILTAAAQPAVLLAARVTRGTLELERDRPAAALAALEAGEPMDLILDGTVHLVSRMRSMLIHALTQAGHHERARAYLAGLSTADRERHEIRVATGALALAAGDPKAALAAVIPVRANPAVEDHRAFWQARAYVIEAIARDRLGDPDAAATAIEHALDHSEVSGDATAFLLYPASGLLDRHAQRRSAHPALVAELRSLVAGKQEGAQQERASRPDPLSEPLSVSETRVLRYLPTNLSLPEISRELSVSHSTVKTHIRHLYTKFGAHSRAEVVTLARALGLLAPSRTAPAHRHAPSFPGSGPFPAVK